MAVAALEDEEKAQSAQRVAAWECGGGGGIRREGEVDCSMEGKVGGRRRRSVPREKKETLRGTLLAGLMPS